MLSISLDRCFEGPGRELDWHSGDEELHQHFNDLPRADKVFIDGRVNYELMASCCSHADQGQVGHGAGARSRAHLALHSESWSRRSESGSRAIRRFWELQGLPSIAALTHMLRSWWGTQSPHTP